MSTGGELGPPRAHLLADVEHRRLVALALADHHRAVDVERVERLAHGVDRGLVGLVLVAAAHQPRRGDGGRLGDAHDFQSRGCDPCGGCLLAFMGTASAASPRSSGSAVGLPSRPMQACSVWPVHEHRAVALAATSYVELACEARRSSVTSHVDDQQVVVARRAR